MFDAFARFANGIISHESSNQGGGGSGGGLWYRGPQGPRPEDDEPDLHLRKDSLRLSGPRVQISLYAPAGQANGKAFSSSTRA